MRDPPLSTRLGTGALPANDSRHITVAPNGDVYVATMGGLAVRIGTTWTKYTVDNSGLVNNACLFVAMADDGKTLYLGTNGAGVSIYRPPHLWN